MRDIQFHTVQIPKSLSSEKKRKLIMFDPMIIHHRNVCVVRIHPLWNHEDSNIHPSFPWLGTLWLADSGIGHDVWACVEGMRGIVF